MHTNTHSSIPLVTKAKVKHFDLEYAIQCLILHTHDKGNTHAECLTSADA